MHRNIILCADGTGNKGGFTPDSNVFKTYNAIDITPPSQSSQAPLSELDDNQPPSSQITFYDNGVGTSSNKIYKALSGALGFGFQRNVRELYLFLCRNYQHTSDDEPDQVYLFGFSRGAATIRALNGFIHDCGLIEPDPNASEEALLAEVTKLLKRYLRACYFKQESLLQKLHSGEPVKGCSSPRKKIKIRFIAVWDTVAALGMPKRTDKTGWLSIVVNFLFNLIDNLFNFLIHHRAYNLDLTPNIDRACQALSIDEARTAFWPLIWNETHPELKNVEVDQLWFAGAHSDVGGGYRRQDMSNVSLLWILEQAEAYGLRFHNEALDSVRYRANVHDKIHDSREGFGIFYRYHPRDIEHLCQNLKSRENKSANSDKNHSDDKLTAAIKIHESVFSRMYYRTAGYAPVLLPPTFKLVDNDCRETSTVELEKTDDNKRNWILHRNLTNKIIGALKEIYVFQMVITLFVAVCVIYVWNCDITYQERIGFWGGFADIAEYLLPNMFNNSVELWINQKPLQVLPLLGIILLWWIARYNLRACLRTNALELRTAVVSSVEPGSSGTVMLSAEQSKYYKAEAIEWIFKGASIFVLAGYLFGRL